ncbi:MAG TPA: hypothetical protein VG346_04485 [Acidimicrobiales bacterium]|nr:hypothetical protein [Acidimicrobiales bacterium]
MNAERDWNEDMQRWSIDDVTADRLLTGGLSPDDAPPGYAPLAATIQTATGPADPAELRGEAAIVAAGVGVVASAHDTLPIGRRTTVRTKLISAKVAAVTTVAVLGLGTAAAALTASLPTPTSHASSHAAAGLATAAAHVPTGAGSHGSSASNGSTGGTGAGGTGPVNGMTNGNATFGLCTALLAAPSQASNPNSGKASSTAFTTLIAAHGGSISAATTFCTGYVAANHPGGGPATTGQPTTAPTDGTDGSATAGRPASPGQSSTGGEPSTTGASSSKAPVTTPNPGGTGTANTASGGSSSAGSSNATGHGSH